MFALPGHPWICENGVAPDRALDPAVLSRLKQFSAMNKLKKMALRVSMCAYVHMQQIFEHSRFYLINWKMWMKAHICVANPFVSQSPMHSISF